MSGTELGPKKIHDAGSYVVRLFLKMPFHITGRTHRTVYADDEEMSVSEWVKFIHARPENPDQAYSSLVARWSAWIELLIVSCITFGIVSFLLDFSVGRGIWFSILLSVMVLVICTGAISGLFVSLRMITVWLADDWAFGISDDESEESISEVSWTLRRRVVRWLCMPSNFEFFIGLLIGIVSLWFLVENGHMGFQ
ncbi:hypothetical protein [Haloechinothrix halophila]|uniref:hypothetical protein n=1 Tax=Haloechinothrix halophila TaxID=1069073 RepID=UPI0012FA5163|nr:hypothetical protein [Haloechinothrix halophila]